MANRICQPDPRDDAGGKCVILIEREKNMDIKILDKTIGPNHPTYFIADIAANHDGDLERAKMLIHLAKEAGADAAKFQNFKAPKIVSDYGFKAMSGGQVSHQAAWKKSVFQVYSEASIPLGWTLTGTPLYVPV